MRFWLTLLVSLFIAGCGAVQVTPTQTATPISTQVPMPTPMQVTQITMHPGIFYMMIPIEQTSEATVYVDFIYVEQTTLVNFDQPTQILTFTVTGEVGPAIADILAIWSRQFDSTREQIHVRLMRGAEVMDEQIYELPPGY